MFHNFLFTLFVMLACADTRHHGNERVGEVDSVKVPGWPPRLHSHRRHRYLPTTFGECRSGSVLPPSGREFVVLFFVCHSEWQEQCICAPGAATYKGQDLLEMAPEERSRAGLFMRCVEPRCQCATRCACVGFPANRCEARKGLGIRQHTEQRRHMQRCFTATTCLQAVARLFFSCAVRRGHAAPDWRWRRQAQAAWFYYGWRAAPGARDEQDRLRLAGLHFIPHKPWALYVSAAFSRRWRCRA